MYTNTKTSISFYTLGCRLNQSETAVIQNSFKRAGYRVVAFNGQADVVVINTCTVTEHGDSDTRRLVNKISRTHPKAKIALIGCQAQIQGEKLTKLPNVKWVIGTARKMDLISIINEQPDSEHPRIVTPAIPRDSFTIPIPGIDSSHTRANIKIQDGCDSFCSYCEIPYARGRARSRQFEDILTEARALVEAGHKELVITGINVGIYSNQEKDIADVIRALEKIRGLERIRISSIEPTTIPDRLLKKMVHHKKLCRYLHIPLQSGDDQVLKLMKRKYSANEFRVFIQKAFRLVPEICIGVDVIVGFPGETDEAFQRTYDFLCESPIHYFHVFSYSQRNLAKSKYFPNKVDPKTIQKRSKLLRQLSQRKRLNYFNSLLGTKQKVLFEQKKRGAWTGLTDHYVRVYVHSPRDMANQLFDVRLEQLEGQKIIGEIS